MTDVYRIGVSIAMTNGVSQVLGVIARDLLGLKRGIGEAEAGFSRMKLAAVGAVSALAGGAALRGLWDMTKAAEKLNTELVKVKIGAGLTDSQIVEARTRAYQMTQAVPGTNVADNVKVQRELFGTFGDMKEVASTLQSVLTANMALSRYGQTDTDVAQVAIRALEMRGHITKDGKVDPVEFNKELDALTRSIIASEGLLKPNDYLMGIRQAGPAAMAMSPDAFWGMMPAAMIAMGSQKAGTALSSLYQQVIGHVVAGKRTAIAMEEAGMLKPGSWKVERGGHVVMDKNAVVNQDQFATSPFEYIHDMIERNRGNKDLTGLIQQIFQLSSRATAARLIADIAQNWPIFQNEQRRYARTESGAAAAADQNNTSLAANIQNVDEAFHNLMTALGEPGIPIAIEIMHKLTTGITDMTMWASTHQDTVAIIEKVAGGLAGLATVLGTLAVGSAAASALGILTGPVGLLAVATGLIALGNALDIIPDWLRYLIYPKMAKVPEAEATETWKKAIEETAGQHTPGAPTPHHWYDDPWVPNRLKPNGNTLPAVPPPLAPQGGPRVSRPGAATPDGTPVNPSAYHPGADQTTVVLTIDGRVLAKGMLKHMKDGLSLPASSSSSFDPRQTLVTPATVLRT